MPWQVEAGLVAASSFDYSSILSVERLKASLQ